ncbi:MAG TPA: nitronate monooxygenase family protein [Microvirga sp.]|jgi:nitronate monooxygenase|nr:nitronate monooxygenase family protein [Microvirga sp.]
MSLPPAFEGRLSVPAIAAPMFLVSGPDLVVEACRAGVVGTFPALNQRSNEGYAAWLDAIESRLSAAEASSGRKPAPFGVNLIVHRTNTRLREDLETTVRHKVPLVITSLGAVSDVVDAVHSYGGVVLHDVINLRHAEKALEAGVDGLIAVAAGAGGHAGTYSPFAFVAELRALTSKLIALSGAISHGREIAAARLLGADFAYLGTRFIATRESLADESYKAMLLASSAKDIVYTPAISGVNANFLRPSIAASGLDPDKLPAGAKLDMGHERKVWKHIWSAGQGTGSIADIPATAELCARLAREYEEALASRASMSLARAVHAA